MIPARFRVFGSALALLLHSGCRPEVQERPSEARDTVPSVTASLVRSVAESGLATPTSVVHDQAADLYLVSNLGSAPAEAGAPGEEPGSGFISRVTPNGEVLDLQWIQAGTPGVTLDGPRSLAILSDTLLVTDLRCVRRFHRSTGRPLDELCVEYATLLDDMAVDSRGNVYFADRGSGETPGAVYLLRQYADVPQKLALADGTLLGEAHPEHPGSLATDGMGLVVAGRGSGGIWRVNARGERVQIVPPDVLEADGLVSLGVRGLLASSQVESAVLWIHPEGQVTPILGGIEAPGDMGFDAVRNRLLIPLVASDELRIVQIR